MCLGHSLFYYVLDFIEYLLCLTPGRCKGPRHSFCSHIAHWCSMGTGTGTDVSNKGYKLPWLRVLSEQMGGASNSAWMGWEKASWRKWPFWRIPLNIVYGSLGFNDLRLSYFKSSKVWVPLEAPSWIWSPLLPTESSSHLGEAYPWKTSLLPPLQLLLEPLWKRPELHLNTFLLPQAKICRKEPCV